MYIRSVEYRLSWLAFLLKNRKLKLNNRQSYTQVLKDHFQ